MEDSNQEIQVPTGFRFLPTDEELVFYYLHRKLTGESLPAGLIGEFNLYSDKNPWEILDKNYTGYFHVFTELRNLSKQKVGRRAGCGTWKGENTKNICDEHGNILWFKKAFVFEIDQNKIQTTTDVQDSGHWLMTEFSLPRAQNYVVCKIYNKEAVEGTTTKSMGSKKRKLPTNTNSAGVGSSKKKKEAIPNSGTSVVHVPQHHNDQTFTVVLEPEIPNNNPSSDYYQERFLQPHNNTAVESYMEEVIPSYGTSDVSIPVPEVQTDPEPKVVQQSDEDDFNEILFLLEDVDNNIEGTETNMEMIPSPEYGTSLVPIPENEDDRTLTHVLEPEQEQVKQSTEDDKNIIPKTTLLESYMEEVIPSSEYVSFVVPIQVTEDQNDPELGPVAFEQSTEDEDDPQQLLFAEDFDIAGTANCIEEITSPESEPEQEPVKQSMGDDHTIIPICDFKFGDEDDDQTTLLSDNFQHLMEPDDINFDQFPFPALHHEDQTSSVPELPLDHFHFPPLEYDSLTSLHCY